jgi:hypothetical protein
MHWIEVHSVAFFIDSQFDPLWTKDLNLACLHITHDFSLLSNKQQSFMMMSLSPKNNSCQLWVTQIVTRKIVTKRNITTSFIGTFHSSCSLPILITTLRIFKREWLLISDGFFGRPYKGKDTVFRFIIEYSSFMDFGP